MFEPKLMDSFWHYFPGAGDTFNGYQENILVQKGNYIKSNVVGW